ncbi:ABC transporter [Prosthecochloris sp. GSB1]|uniref:ABC transporter ATP-binding protein n=1 Tax=Prosthecochloris sp. GSB1 TaxID=281093 RepID=UPI000B8CB254|nr:ABC transporter ATP-binding protein [Prosthecochloris sp. GSB1]ASQ90441.1 ABC transporter [Prosthecochloris sp. GSB1]
MKAVTLQGVSKRFGDFWANRDISLDIREGSIHAIVGENGAGKSTLTNLIYGMHAPTEGTISVMGKPVRFSSPRQAIAEGIGMVHQHFMLVPDLTVAENIVLGEERSALFAPVDLSGAAEHIARLASGHGMEIEPRARVAELSVGEEQRVEILKLLYRNARILILDEPTAVLTPSETVQLFNTLESLRKSGRTVILITHKLDEVMAVSDTVSVMRKGRIVATRNTDGLSKTDMARMMVGRNVLLRVENPPETPGEAVLNVRRLTWKDARGRARLSKLDFSVRAGEIYGIAGVEGNGQSELLSLLWGMAKGGEHCSGSVTMLGQPLDGKNSAEIAALGVSFIPEDRLKHAIVPEYSVSENLIFGRHRERRFSKFPGFDKKKISDYARLMTGRYDIRYDTASDPTLRSLSGGNQQKIVLAREIDRPGLKLLILAQPTRGVDIGAIETIHRKIIETRDRGIGVLLVSAELDEIVALSSRIGCLYKGSIRHEFQTEEIRKGRSREKDFEKEIGRHIT